MLRVTPSQAKLLFGKPAKAAGKKSHVKKKRQDLLENQVEKAINDFLFSAGWTVTKEHVGRFRGKGNTWISVGEVHMADWRAQRPMSGLVHWLFYYEAKAPGQKPDQGQLLWLDRRRSTGTPADWFDSLDVGKKPFLPWYRATFDATVPLTMHERKQALAND